MAGKNDIGFEKATHFQTLRKRVEETLAAGDKPLKDMSAHEMSKLIYELHIHQVELEMQNEELRKNQAETERSPKAHQHLWELSPVGHLMVDAAGRVAAVNRAGQRLFDRPENVLLNERFKTLVSPENQVSVHLMLERAAQTGIAEREEIGILKPDGAVHICLLEVSSLGGEPGREKIQVVLTDITDRRQAEKERKILQAQLVQAQKMEAIATLAGGIAHKFNNVLMGIQGRASLMIMDKDPSHPDYGHLNGIEESVKSAAELTRDLLGFARGGKYEVKPTDLNALIERENMMFGRTKEEIQVHGKYNNDLWAVEVDRGQIKRVLLNLYMNAWQAMPGGGDLYIQTDNVTLDEAYIRPFEVALGRYVKISVTDTGTGMDAPTRQRIFDPFFSMNGTGRGSGLGLASVYGIVKHHGGFINVYSEKGEGTTFNFYLPAAEEQLVEESPGPDGHKVQYGQGTVLLVDDEGMIIDVGQQMLERLGYRVLVARNGREALGVYGEKREEIDLVILDMIMPDMGGGETYDRIKDLDESVMVLLSSGYSINGQAKEIMDRGCKGFIQKPFSINDLSIKVREALDEVQG